MASSAETQPTAQTLQAQLDHERQRCIDVVLQLEQEHQAEMSALREAYDALHRESEQHRFTTSTASPSGRTRLLTSTQDTLTAVLPAVQALSRALQPCAAQDAWWAALLACMADLQQVTQGSSLHAAAASLSEQVRASQSEQPSDAESGSFSRDSIDSPAMLRRHADVTVPNLLALLRLTAACLGLVRKQLRSPPCGYEEELAALQAELDAARAAAQRAEDAAAAEKQRYKQHVASDHDKFNAYITQLKAEHKAALAQLQQDADGIAQHTIARQLAPVCDSLGTEPSESVEDTIAALSAAALGITTSQSELKQQLQDLQALDAQWQEAWSQREQAWTAQWEEQEEAWQQRDAEWLECCQTWKTQRAALLAVAQDQCEHARPVREPGLASPMAGRARPGDGDAAAAVLEERQARADELQASAEAAAAECAKLRAAAATQQAASDAQVASLRGELAALVASSASELAAARAGAEQQSQAARATQEQLQAELALARQECVAALGQASIDAAAQAARLQDQHAAEVEAERARASQELSAALEQAAADHEQALAEAAAQAAAGQAAALLEAEQSAGELLRQELQAAASLTEQAVATAQQDAQLALADQAAASQRTQAALEAELCSANETLAALKEAAQAAEARAQAEKARADAAEASAQHKTEQLGVLERSLHELEAAVEDRASVVASASETAHAASQAAVAQAEAVHAGQVARIIELEQQVAGLQSELEQQVSALRADLASAEEEAAEARQAAEIATDARERADMELQAMTVRAEAGASALRAAHADVHAAQSECEQANAERDAARDQAAQLRAQVDALQLEAAAGVEQLQQDAAAAQQQMRQDLAPLAASLHGTAKLLKSHLDMLQSDAASTGTSTSTTRRLPLSPATLDRPGPHARTEPDVSTADVADLVQLVELRAAAVVNAQLSKLELCQAQVEAAREVAAAETAKSQKLRAAALQEAEAARAQARAAQAETQAVTQTCEQLRVTLRQTQASTARASPAPRRDTHNAVSVQAAAARAVPGPAAQPPVQAAPAQPTAPVPAAGMPAQTTGMGVPVHVHTMQRDMLLLQQACRSYQSGIANAAHSITQGSAMPQSSLAEAMQVGRERVHALAAVAASVGLPASATVAPAYQQPTASFAGMPADMAPTEGPSHSSGMSVEQLRSALRARRGPARAVDSRFVPAQPAGAVQPTSYMPAATATAPAPVAAPVHVYAPPTYSVPSHSYATHLTPAQQRGQSGPDLSAQRRAVRGVHTPTLLPSPTGKMPASSMHMVSRAPIPQPLFGPPIASAPQPGGMFHGVLPAATPQAAPPPKSKPTKW